MSRYLFARRNLPLPGRLSAFRRISPESHQTLEQLSRSHVDSCCRVQYKLPTKRQAEWTPHHMIHWGGSKKIQMKVRTMMGKGLSLLWRLRKRKPAYTAGSCLYHSEIVHEQSLQSKDIRTMVRQKEEACVHAISFLKLLHAFAKLLYISGHIRPKDGGEFLNKYSIFLYLPVHWVERRCLNFDQDFAGSRFIDRRVLNDKIAKSLVETKCFLRGRHRVR